MGNILSLNRLEAEVNMGQCQKNRYHRVQLTDIDTNTELCPKNFDKRAHPIRHVTFQYMLHYSRHDIN